MKSIKCRGRELGATKSNFRSGLDRSMSRFFLLVVSLATSAIVMASPSAMSVANMLSKHKFTAHSKEFTVSNIANGGFPTNPKYGVLQYFNSGASADNCTDHYQSVSYLLDTCMASNTTSVIYSCENEVLTRVSHLGTSCDSPIEKAKMTPGECVHGLMASICNTTNPFNLGDGDYTTISYNQANTCENPLSVIGTVNNYCLSFSNSSKKFAWPYYYTYTASDACTGPNERTDLSDRGCHRETGDDDDDGDDAAAHQAYTSFGYLKLGTGGGSSSSDSEDSLSPGSIAGIVIGGVAFLALIGPFLVLTPPRQAASDQERERDDQRRRLTGPTSTV